MTGAEEVNKMQLSRASGQALQALACLIEGNGKLTHASRIATTNGVTPVYLRTILGKLEVARILHSQRGTTGGYRLARPPASITLLEIVETVEGSIRGNATLDETGKLQAVVDGIAEGTRAELAKVTLAELVGKGKKAKVTR